MNLRYYKALELLLLTAVIIIFSTAKISYSSHSLDRTNAKIHFFMPVINKLISNGVDSLFIFELISDPKTNFNDKFVKINVTGFLNKYDYSHNFSKYSVKSCKEFINEHLPYLNQVESDYNVPKEIITSILWIESKHGSYLGESHIPSVFLSTAMADQDEFVKINKAILKETYSNDSVCYIEFEKKLTDRAKKKAEWALKELVYLSKIYNTTSLDIHNLKGSWAGAFGLPQFLPSSYVNYAIDGNSNGFINLFELEDAISSIANYLHYNGWGNTEEEHRKAIFNYNNSQDYVNAVLTLAAKI